MKIPLRFQITSFDCGTVSLTNAISYLFEREEIPAELIRAISIYTLDCYDENGNLGNGGTSRESVNLVSNWITNFTKTKDFKIICERLEGKEVTLEKIKSCIKKKGAVLVRLWLEDVEHYVILTNIDDQYVYLFDPYYFEEDYYDNDSEVKMIFDQPFTHNRIVTLKRFLSEGKKDFALGKIAKRECVLIYRK